MTHRLRCDACDKPEGPGVELSPAGGYVLCEKCRASKDDADEAMDNGRNTGGRSNL